MVAAAGEVLAADAGEGTCEIRQARRGGFVGEDACVKYLRQPVPSRSADAIGETEAFEVDFGSQF